MSVPVPEIEVSELAALPDGTTVIDVRQPGEWTEVRVPNAHLIPLDQVEERIGEVPTDAPVYVICRSGGRSHRAAEYLIANGIDARNVKGGTMAWLEAGYDVVRGDEEG